MKTPKNTETRAWPGSIPLESLYTTGLAGQMFFSALQERGEIVGSLCDPCKQLYVPARAFCERCFAELTKPVAVKPEGTLVSFTFCGYDRDQQPLATPQALALVRLDGATTVMLHYLLKVSRPDQVRIGARVRAVIKPRPKRAGSILDIQGFQLI